MVNASDPFVLATKTSGIRAKVSSHPLLSFFALAFLISWAIWLPLFFERSTADPTSGPLWPLFYLGGVGPAAAAIICTAVVDGRAGLRRLAKRVAGIGSDPRWAVLGATLPLILLAALVIGVAAATGFWMAMDQVLISSKLPDVSILGILFFELAFFGFGEEAGWRGFAWPHLRARHGFVVSSALVTGGWALWHLPTFFFNPNMASLGLGGTVGWVISLFAGSIVLGWLADRSGSALPAALFHGVLDVVFISAAVAGTYDVQLGIAIMVLAGVIAIWEMTRRLREQRRPD